jgi:quercetin dioxygenase-like cupin family protein
MTAIRQPIFRQPDEGRTIAVVGDTYRFLAMGEDTDGRYATWEAIVPPGSGPPPHIHSREEESFFVLEGEITIQIEEERIVAKAGTFANMPVGSLHSFKNETEKNARMIISIAPAGLEKMFFDVGQQLAPDGTAPPPSKAEIERMLSVAAKYGVEIKVPAH